MDSELIPGRDADYRKWTADDPTGEKRAIWEKAYNWGLRQGMAKGRNDLKREIRYRLGEEYDDD